MAINPNPWEKSAYIAIGATIVAWSRFCDTIRIGVQWIEMSAHDPNEVAFALTDMGAFRNDRARRRHLRKLVQKHGTKELIADLNQAIQSAVDQDDVRHELAHANLRIDLTDYDRPTTFKDVRISGGSKIYTIPDLIKAHDVFHAAAGVVNAVSGEVSRSIPRIEVNWPRGLEPAKQPPL
jgi:hypothetical protein